MASFGATVAELRARLSVDPSDRAKFKRDMADADRTMGRTATSGSRSFSKLGTAIKLGLIGGAAAGFYALGKAAKIGWDEYNQGAKVAAQTNAVIKSTGGVAKVSAKDVESLGRSLMSKSGIDDEVIKSGENMLLTFTNIRNELGKGNDIFDQTTKLTLDMSVAMGKDLNSSAIMVGKALNDPILGLTSLSRVGVKFTQETKDQITALVESGKTMEAQKRILKELRTEFGGSAKAAGETLAGQINVLKESFNNWAGDMVAKVIPTITTFVDFIDRIRKQRSWDIRIRTILAGAGGALDDLLFGTPGKQVRVPIEGGRIAWEIKPGNQGLVAALAKAIRDIDWHAVGVAIQHGMQDAIDAAIPGLNPNQGLLRQKVGRDWVGGVISGFEDGFRSNGIDPNKGLLGQLFPNQAGFLNKQLTVPKFMGIDLNKGLLTNLGITAEDAFAATDRAMNDTARKSNTFADAYGEHMAQVATDTGHSTDMVEGLRAKIGELKSKTVHVTADVSGLSTTAALAEHLALINRNKNINVTVNGPSGDGLIGVGGVGAAGVSPTLFDDLGLAQAMGLVLSSGYRPGAVTLTGNPSLHGVYPSKAIDVSGSEASMAAFFRSEVARAPFTGIRELIHNPYAWYPGAGIVNIAGTALGRDHIDHVHVGSYDQGGYLRPGWNIAYNGLGRNEPVGFGGVTVNVSGSVIAERDLRALINKLDEDHYRRGGR